VGWRASFTSPAVSTRDLLSVARLSFLPLAEFILLTIVNFFLKFAGLNDSAHEKAAGLARQAEGVICTRAPIRVDIHSTYLGVE